MSFTQTQLDALRAAAAKGIRTVKTDGHEVTYASVDEMLRLIKVMEAQVTRSRSSHVNPVFDKGV